MAGERLIGQLPYPRPSVQFSGQFTDTHGGSSVPGGELDFYGRNIDLWVRLIEVQKLILHLLAIKTQPCSLTSLNIGFLHSNFSFPC